MPGPVWAAELMLMLTMMDPMMMDLKLMLWRKACTAALRRTSVAKPGWRKGGSRSSRCRLGSPAAHSLSISPLIRAYTQ